MRDKLIYAGLSPREADIYLELVKLGEATPNTLAKRLSIERTVTYNTLNKLAEKGFVTHIQKEGQRYFLVADVENLMRPLKEKETILQETIEKLKKIRTIAPITSTVQIYEGTEGLKTIYNIILKHKNMTIHSLGTAGLSLDVLRFEFPHLAKKFERQGIKVKAIMNSKAIKHPVTKISTLNARYLPKEFDTTAVTNIFKDYVAINLSEKPIIVLIKNKEMAKVYKKYFEVLWVKAKKIY